MQGEAHYLALESVSKGDSDSVSEGILICTNNQCLREYPIIDGLPVIITDLRSYFTNNHTFLYRQDLSEITESIIGDCMGPGSAFDTVRQHLSTYCHSHYGDLSDRATGLSPDNTSSLASIFEKSIAMSDIEKPSGPVIDTGCACGRTTFELAGRSNDLVLGVDMNFGLMQKAVEVLSTKSISYPLRRTGVVYQKISHETSFEMAENVDFWICDVSNLPFLDNTFQLALSFNVLDSTTSPFDHLQELARIIELHGKALLCSPYDWSPNATAVESWIGGHSQRSKWQGLPENVIKTLLAEGVHPLAIKSLTVIAENKEVPWTLRIHDRSIMQYMVHLLTLLKIDPKS